MAWGTIDRPTPPFATRLRTKEVLGRQLFDRAEPSDIGWSEVITGLHERLTLVHDSRKGYPSQVDNNRRRSCAIFDVIDQNMDTFSQACRRVAGRAGKQIRRAKADDAAAPFVPWSIRICMIAA
jgi:hypothetical protein